MTIRHISTPLRHTRGAALQGGHAAWLAMLFLFSSLLLSCSETDETVEEFPLPEWEETNTAYFTDLYNSATQSIARGDTTWRIIRCWSLPDDNPYYVGVPEDHIVVEVVEEGQGEGCPLYTDNAWIHYKGNLLPSVSYPAGYIFDQSYYGDFNENTAVPIEMQISALIDGFTTALLNMHIGDHWRVYIPYQLGYGEYGSSAIPGYSLLIFEIRLVAYARADVDLPMTW